MRAGEIDDRSRAIRKHLFLLCPNNSGSTYLSQAIATSPAVWSLPHEGQHMIGFAGPSTLDTPWPLIWAAEEDSLAHFRDSPDYDWQRTARAWYFHARAGGPDASVFHTKSPPFLLIPDQLVQNFADTSFLFMVRNPYAALEGILRRRKMGTMQDGPDLPRIAAQHLVACMRAQRSNIERYAGRSIAFTYEELCAAPTRIADRIAQLVPELSDLDLSQRMLVKGQYDEELRNMNDEQIARLSSADIALANAVFAEAVDVLSYFDYSVLD